MTGRGGEGAARSEPAGVPWMEQEDPDSLPSSRNPDPLEQESKLVTPSRASSSGAVCSAEAAGNIHYAESIDSPACPVLSGSSRKLGLSCPTLSSPLSSQGAPPACLSAIGGSRPVRDGCRGPPETSSQAKVTRPLVSTVAVGARNAACVSPCANTRRWSDGING